MAAVPLPGVKGPAFPQNTPGKSLELLEFSGVFRGRELTRKDRRLPSYLIPADALLGGGLVRGRISEIVGPASSGKTSLAAAFVVSATRRGEAAAWLDFDRAFDPQSMAAAGVDLSRLLWIAPGTHGWNDATPHRRDSHTDFPSPRPAEEGEDEDAVNRFVSRDRARRAVKPKNAVRAAELVLEAGGFGLVVIDFGNHSRPLQHSAALRLARMAERSGTSVVVLAARPLCGTFAVTGLALDSGSPIIARAARPRSGVVAIGVCTRPSLFDGLAITARVTRNKMGASFGGATWQALADLDRTDSPFPSQKEERRVRSI